MPEPSFPIPLKFTSLNLDITIANNLSKAKLYCAIQSICTKYPSVGYLPYYKFIQQNKKDCWQVDSRHLNANAILDLAEILFPIIKQKKFKKLIHNFYVPKVNIDGKIVGKLFIKKYEIR